MSILIDLLFKQRYERYLLTLWIPACAGMT